MNQVLQNTKMMLLLSVSFKTFVFFHLPFFFSAFKQEIEYFLEAKLFQDPFLTFFVRICTGVPGVEPFFFIFLFGINGNFSAK